MSISVCPKSCQDPAANQLHRRRTAACITHVRLWIVNYHGIRLPDQIHLMRIDVDTMPKQRLLSQYIPIHQPVNDPLAVLLQAVVKILDAFRHMNVISCPVWLIGRRKFHRLVRDGKLRMHSHHSGNHIRIVLQSVADELRILHHGLTRLIHPVSVRDLIAQTGSYSQFLRRIRYGKQTVFDVPEACMMIEDGRHTVADTGDHSIHCAVFRLFKRQLPVYGPPLSV